MNKTQYTGGIVSIHGYTDINGSKKPLIIGRIYLLFSVYEIVGLVCS